MTPGVGLTDSHAHLTSSDFAGRVPEVLRAAREAGVTRVLTVSCSAGDARAVADLATAHDGVLAAAGIHPHEAALFEEGHALEVAELARAGRLVAVGEIGLDYHYDRSPRDRQRDVFRRQVRLARELDLPIVVHAREADEDAATILREEGADRVGGVLHCFTAGPELAAAALDLGLTLSFSGILTYPSAGPLRQIARELPGGSFMVETDAPYLAPVPRRRSWPNEPAWVVETARALADLRECSLEQVAEETSATFERTFRLGVS